MKLYTFQQLQDSYLSGKFTKLTFEELIQYYKPIELPSDEEIDKNGYHNKEYDDIWKEGAKWMSEIDFELAMIEDYAHGDVGEAITKLRHKIANHYTK